MTYQPFLPEVVGGHIEARHAVVPHRKHLKDTEVITGKVTSVDHEAKVAIVGLDEGESVEVPYQDIVMAAGATTRTFPIEGLAENGIGLKTIEEALGLRNHILERLESASVMTDEAAKKRALTFAVVGGGFAGIECVAEMEDIIRAYVSENPGSPSLTSVLCWSRPWDGSCQKSLRTKRSVSLNTCVVGASKCCSTPPWVQQLMAN